MNLRQKCQALAAPLIMMISAVSILLLQLPKLNDNLPNQDTETLAQQEQQEKLRLTLRRQMPTLGFDNLLADWAFLDFLQYFGDGEARKLNGYALVSDYFSLAVEHNPRFASAYFYFSPANTLFAGNPQLSVDLMNKGLEVIDQEFYPEVYYLWIAKAVDELLFLDNPDAARQSYRMATLTAERVDLPHSQEIAERTRETADFLADNPLSLQAQIGSWFMILSNSPDEATRQQVIDKIREKGGDITISTDGKVQVKLPKTSADN